MTQLSEHTAKSHTAGNSFLMGQVHLAQCGACSLASTSYDKICVCNFKNSLYPKLEGLYAGGGLQASLGKIANVPEGSVLPLLPHCCVKQQFTKENKSFAKPSSKVSGPRVVV